MADILEFKRKEPIKDAITILYSPDEPSPAPLEDPMRKAMKGALILMGFLSFAFIGVCWTISKTITLIIWLVQLLK